MEDRFDEFNIDSNFLFHALNNNCSDYVYLRDFSHGCYRVSPNFAEEFAIRSEGEDFLSVWQPFIDARDLDRVNGTIYKAFDQNEPKISIEYRVRNLQGNCTWLKDTFTISYNKKNGAPALVAGVISALSSVNEDNLHNELLIGDKQIMSSMLNATPLGMIFWNRDMQIISCNKEALTLFDSADFNELKENFFKFSPERQQNGKKSSQMAQEILCQAFCGEIVRCYWQHCKKTGDVMPSEVTIVRVPYMSDYLVISYTRDMRAQRLLEEKIEKFNIRLAAILDSTPLCLNLWNGQYENMMCNNAAVNLFDLRDQQEYLNRFFELSPEYQPDGSLSSEKAAAYISQAFTSEKAVQFEWMHQKLNGEKIPAEITLIKIEGLDEDGRDLVAGYTRDLRSQIESEKLQQTIHKRIRAVLDSSPLSCILWSTDLTLIDCNQVAVRMLGARDKSEIIENFDYFMPKYQPDGSESISKKEKKFEEIFEKNNLIFEWVYLNKQREEVPCQITMVKIPLEKEGIIVGYSRDLRELHYTLQLNDRLSKMAYFDLLTGISSRARFIEKLEKEFVLAPTDDSFALILFDIDYFKQVNDTYGHEAGDIVLKRIAKFVEKTIPSNAFLGRFGGDEFIILIKNTNPKALCTLMKQIVQNIVNLTFYYDGDTFTTSISMGGSFKSEDDDDYHQLINRADKALYEAKAQGRNCSALL